MAKLLWALLSLTTVMGATPLHPDDSISKAVADARPPITEHWSKAYRELHALISRFESDATRNFFPRFMMIKDGNYVVTLPLDAFSVHVLKEADTTLSAYRNSLQECVEKNQNEYHATQPTSFERFGWFLDSYVRTLLIALNGSDEASPLGEGVRSRKVTTDRAIYAFTRILGAYIDEKAERNKKLEAEDSSLAADRAVQTVLNDVARRVFKIDLTQKFDRKEFIEKGMQSQPVLREVASVEGGTDFSLGIAPLLKLTNDGGSEPICRISLTTKQPL